MTANRSAVRTLQEFPIARLVGPTSDTVLEYLHRVLVLTELQIALSKREHSN